ncbi:3-keto-5-aminohexanoate cleavage protein [Streptomyces sp. NPDC101150]|uniref:3-keto-5-aminohexanoate cleavage protein n=1 Tax=Streptomyces sp. NPDC101150 TaxID=3366114 RepID=UPI003813132E
MASIAEAEALYGMGCRYYHYHARNPLTHEQTTDNEIYQEISRGVQRRCKDLLISFGASRNGGEVRERIRAFGEWERVSQCAIPLHLGGAHYVTIQAAVELQIICELERQLEKQGRVLDLDFVTGPEFLTALDAYEPSDRVQDAQLDTHSTSKGADYGKTSPLIQFQVYRNAIRARQQLVLFHEIEWVQLLRSYAMTRYAVEHPAMRLGSSGQLNITLLFGFSPRLPFPDNYAAFKKVVDAAKSLEYDLAEPGVKKRKVTISVGAAVLPQHADQHFKELDVGPRRGTKACAVRRLAAWASQPDSRVDILRVGMEDTPYLVDGAGQVQLADNIQLIGQAIEEVDANGAGLELDHDAIFARMGLLGVQDELLSVQRERPLGAALPEAAPEVTSEAAPEADPAGLVTVG